jgi:formylglycine-generating enzyme required for sulfatase activity/cytochrome oxidase Cu insertion factor (SCO1/SenC/PrrC family)
VRAVAAALALATAFVAAPVPMKRIPGGTYRPFFRVKGETAREVAPFDLDERPVTNGEYLAFVRENPSWARSRVGRVEADESYLSHWAGDLELGADADAQAPVTFVSWFAATAYCHAQGKRLPGEAEWERAAMPEAADAAARDDAERRILAFYGGPRGPLPHAGDTPPNAFGVRDLYGVVWEWVADWGEALPASDPGADVCGGAAALAGAPEDYATLMRFEFRASVEPRFALHHLGFRCARDAGAPGKPAGPTEVFAGRSLWQLPGRWERASGGELELAELRGAPALLLLFYGSCDSACPALVHSLQQVDRELSPGARETLRFVLVTIDPERDTREALARYARERELDPQRWLLLRGPDEQVRQLAAAIGVRARAAPGGPLSHTARIVLVDRDGLEREHWDGLAAPVAPIARAASAAAAERS